MSVACGLPAVASFGPTPTGVAPTRRAAADWTPPVPKPVPLTPREREAFRLVAQGLTVAEAARALGVSANTIKTHLKSAYAKLDVRTRAGAAHAARRLGLLAEPARR